MLYVPAPSETPSIFGVAPRVLTTYMELKYQIDTIDTACGFRVAGSGSLQVIDWGDSSALDQYEYFTGAINNQTHTYIGNVALYRTANVFHNNDIGELRFAEAFLPSTAKIVSIKGDLPDGMHTIQVGDCSALGTDSGGVAVIDLTNCPLIYWIQLITCVNAVAIDTAVLFPAPQPNLRIFRIINCSFTSGAVDDTVNDFCNISWDGVVGGGSFQMNLGAMAAPTAASLTNRNALLATTPPWVTTFTP